MLLTQKEQVSDIVTRKIGPLYFTTVQSTDDFAINEDMYIHRAAEPRELHFFNWNSFFVVLSNLG